MEKLWTAMRVRMSEQMANEIRGLAELEHRPLLHEIRHLISLGLEQKRASGVHGTSVASGGGNEPGRGAEILAGHAAQKGTA